jgi:hypothetical protein
MTLSWIFLAWPDAVGLNQGGLVGAMMARLASWVSDNHPGGVVNS